MAVNALGHLHALQVTPANAQERAQVRVLTKEVQHVTGETVKLAFVDQAIRELSLYRRPRKKTSNFMW